MLSCYPSALFESFASFCLFICTFEETRFLLFMSLTLGVRVATNEEVKARIGSAFGPYEDLLTSVKRRKLKWYGHVTRSSGLAKFILQGTVQGWRRRGRQRKRWKTTSRSGTGLEWNIILRKAENREEWRKLVGKSTVVPQRSARLRDR